MRSLLPCTWRGVGRPHNPEAPTALLSWCQVGTALVLVMTVLSLCVIGALEHYQPQGHAPYATWNPKAAVAYKKQFHDSILAEAQHHVDEWLERMHPPESSSNNTTIAKQAKYTPTASVRYDETNRTTNALIVISAQRKRRYLDVVLASLLFDLDLTPRVRGGSNTTNHSLEHFTMQTRDCTFAVLNTVRPPLTNPELQRWQQLLPELQVLSTDENKTISTYNNTNNSTPTHLVHYLSYNMWKHREFQDYLTALDWCIKTAPREWCILLEDDALPTRHFWQKFRQVVQEPLRSSPDSSLSSYNGKYHQIAFVKLFVSDFWDGFETTGQHLIEILVLGVVSVLIANRFLWTLIVFIGSPQIDNVALRDDEGEEEEETSLPHYTRTNRPVVDQVERKGGLRWLRWRRVTDKEDREPQSQKNSLPRRNLSPDAKEKQFRFSISALLLLLSRFLLSISFRRRLLAVRRRSISYSNLQWFVMSLLWWLTLYCLWRLIGRQTTQQWWERWHGGFKSLLQNRLLYRSFDDKRSVSSSFVDAWYHLDRLQGSAGTVGVAFPMPVVPRLVQFLKQNLNETMASGRTTENIDRALNVWIKSLGPSSGIALRTQPSLVQHMGAYSTARTKNQGNFAKMKQDSGFMY